MPKNTSTYLCCCASRPTRAPKPCILPYLVWTTRLFTCKNGIVFPPQNQANQPNIYLERIWWQLSLQSGESQSLKHQNDTEENSSHLQKMENWHMKLSEFLHFCRHIGLFKGSFQQQESVTRCTFSNKILLRFLLICTIVTFVAFFKNKVENVHLVRWKAFWKVPQCLRISTKWFTNLPPPLKTTCHERG